MVIDTKKMLDAIRSYEFHARPSNSDNSKPCTNGDLNKVISETAKLLKQFVAELEQR